MARNQSELSADEAAKRLNVDRGTFAALLPVWFQELDLRAVRFLLVEEHHSAKSLAKRMNIDPSTAYDLLNEARGKVHLGKKCKRVPASRINALLQEKTI